MANCCYYEIHAKGPKRNVLALGCMFADYNGDKKVMLAKGDEDSFELWFKGDCKGELDAYCKEDPDIIYEPFEDDDIDDDDLESCFYEFFDEECCRIPMRQKSEILKVEIIALSVDEGEGFINIDHYNKGKKIASVNILEEQVSTDLLKEFDLDPENIAESVWERMD